MGNLCRDLNFSEIRYRMTNTSKESKENMKFRNYMAKKTKLSELENQTTHELKEKPNLANPLYIEDFDSLLESTTNSSNWDLKKDIEASLEKLEKETLSVLVELNRQGSHQ